MAFTFASTLIEAQLRRLRPPDAIAVNILYCTEGARDIAAIVCAMMMVTAPYRSITMRINRFPPMIVFV